MYSAICNITSVVISRSILCLTTLVQEWRSGDTEAGTSTDPERAIHVCIRMGADIAKQLWHTLLSMSSPSNRCERFVISLLEFSLTCTGPPLAPPPPTFSLLGPTSVALILSNDPPFSPLPITNYTIEYFISDMPTRVTTITVTPGAVQVTLTDMQTSHSYTVTVYASNAAGISQGTTVPLPSFQVPCE